jgi:putative restriction endonuclease
MIYEFYDHLIRGFPARAGAAVTGWDLRISNANAGLEAAHIKWHTAGGPSVEANGIALNSLHHKLFDLGAFTLSIEDVPRILVSQDVHGGDFARQMLIVPRACSPWRAARCHRADRPFHRRRRQRP